MKIRIPEFTTLCVAIVPTVEPAPTLTVPAEIVRAPSNVLAPDKVKLPVPCLGSLPFVPEPTPANVVDESLARVSVFVGLPVVFNVTVELVPSPEVAIDATVSSNPARLKLALFAITTADELEIRSAAPSATVPADTVVVPVYVLSPDNVNVPVPDFVNVPVDVAIGSATTTSPVFASNVKLNVPVNALPDDGSNVNVPESA